MIIENTCRACGNHYSGHWHDDPNWLLTQCPKCGSHNIFKETDEDKDYDNKFDVEEKELEEVESND